MKKYCVYPIILALFALSACGQKTILPGTQDHLPPESVPEIGGAVPENTVPESTVPDPDAVPVPDESAVTGDSQAQDPLLSAVRPVRRSRPKVLTRMIETAKKQLRKKQPGLAFSTLEQALYIDGQDPLVWHLMAKAQYDQGNIAQAVTLAKKSNSLAAAYPDVKKKNAALLLKAQGGTF